MTIFSDVYFCHFLRPFPRHGVPAAGNERHRAHARRQGNIATETYLSYDFESIEYCRMVSKSAVALISIVEL